MKLSALTCLLVATIACGTPRQALAQPELPLNLNYYGDYGEDLDPNSPYAAASFTDMPNVWGLVDNGAQLGAFCTVSPDGRVLVNILFRNTSGRKIAYPSAGSIEEFEITLTPPLSTEPIAVKQSRALENRWFKFKELAPHSARVYTADLAQLMGLPTLPEKFSLSIRRPVFVGSDFGPTKLVATPNCFVNVPELEMSGTRNDALQFASFSPATRRPGTKPTAPRLQGTARRVQSTAARAGQSNEHSLALAAADLRATGFPWAGILGIGASVLLLFALSRLARRGDRPQK